VLRRDPEVHTVVLTERITQMVREAQNFETEKQQQGTAAGHGNFETQFLRMVGALDWDLGPADGNAAGVNAAEGNAAEGNAPSASSVGVGATTDRVDRVHVVTLGDSSLLRVPVLYLIPAAEPEPRVFNWPYLREAFTGVKPLAAVGGSTGSALSSAPLRDKVIMIYERNGAHGGKRECTNQPQVFAAIERWCANGLHTAILKEISQRQRQGQQQGRVQYTAVKFNSKDYTQQQTIELFASAAVVIGVHGTPLRIDTLAAVIFIHRMAMMCILLSPLLPLHFSRMSVHSLPHQ
jgi:hypothetical protein